MAAASFGWSLGGCWSQSQGQNGLVLLAVVFGKVAPTVSREGLVLWEPRLSWLLPSIHLTMFPQLQRQLMRSQPRNITHEEGNFVLHIDNGPLLAPQNKDGLAGLWCWYSGPLANQKIGRQISVSLRLPGLKRKF